MHDLGCPEMTAKNKEICYVIDFRFESLSFFISCLFYSIEFHESKSIFCLSVSFDSWIVYIRCRRRLNGNYFSREYKQRFLHHKTTDIIAVPVANCIMHHFQFIPPNKALAFRKSNEPSQGNLVYLSS